MRSEAANALQLRYSGAIQMGISLVRSGAHWTAKGGNHAGAMVPVASRLDGLLEQGRLSAWKGIGDLGTPGASVRRRWRRP